MTHMQVVLGDAISASEQKGSEEAHGNAGDEENEEEGSSQGYKWAVAGMLSIVLMSYIATAFSIDDSDGTAASGSSGWFVQIFKNAFSLTAFVTYEDKAAFVATTLYVIYYCVRIQWSGWTRSLDKRTPKPINPVLASITAAVQRIYGTVDNPYTPTTTFLMLTWTMHKISVFKRSAVLQRLRASAKGSDPSVSSIGWWTRASDILFDCFLLSMLLYTGVVIQASPVPHIDRMQRTEHSTDEWHEKQRSSRMTSPSHPSNLSRGFLQPWP
jgi:hypothetical protein